MADGHEAVEFIVNNSAGRRRINLARMLETACGGSSGVEIRHTEYRGHAEVLTRASVDAGARLIVAVGGDGTVNEVASGLLNSAAVLGIVPTGSGNAIARTLGIPLRAPDASRSLFSEPGLRPRTIDAGTVDGHCFLATAGIGIDALTCSIYAERGEGAGRGLLPYLRALFKASRQFRAAEIAITVDGDKTVHLTPAQVTIANGGQFGYGAVSAPAAHLDDGELDLQVIAARSSIRLLWDCRRLFTGDIDEAPGLRSWRGHSISIERAQPGPIQADGEVFEAGTELEFKVLPQALQVMAP